MRRYEELELGVRCMAAGIYDDQGKLVAGLKDSSGDFKQFQAFRAAAPMIRALLQRYPQLPITVTCMTPTGSERIHALFANEPRIQHCYLPYDLPCAAASSIR